MEESVGSAAATMVTVALALSVGSATEVAVIVAVPAVAEAVYMPEFGSMLPTPVRLQVTVWLAVPETLAVKGNCSLVPTVQDG
jgi:hypothetical protein